MKVILRTAEGEREIDVHENQVIAEAALEQGIQLYGSCQGKGVCTQCSRYVVEGVRSVLNAKTGEPYFPSDGYAPYVLTCNARPSEEGVIIDTSRRGRF